MTHHERQLELLGLGEAGKGTSTSSISWGLDDVYDWLFGTPAEPLPPEGPLVSPAAQDADMGLPGRPGEVFEPVLLPGQDNEGPREGLITTLPSVEPGGPILIFKEGDATGRTEHGKDAVFFTSKKKWTAPSRGTGLQYEVFQQEIDWTLEVKGKTNLDRARGGGAPYVMKDGSPRQLHLHHSRQNGQGPLFELTKDTHLRTKSTEGKKALHPYGKKKHPDFPVNRPRFRYDVDQYWIDRASEVRQ